MKMEMKMTSLKKCLETVIGEMLLTRCFPQPLKYFFHILSQNLKVTQFLNTQTILHHFESKHFFSQIRPRMNPRVVGEFLC